MSAAPYALAFFVPGVPVTKGSTEAVSARGRGGKVYVRATNKGPQDAWSGFVAQAARDAVAAAEWPTTNEIGDTARLGEWEVITLFVIPSLPPGRKTLRKSATEHSVGDGDKLTRCVWDALTGVVYVDDAQVTRWGGGKRLARIGEQPGVQVYVREVEEES